MGIRTHYDNLQVVRNASPEVIKGAYRYLSQRWHPDRNPDNRAEAERITRLVNEAYRVLSDPELRKAHDAWIASQEQRAGAAPEYPPGATHSADGVSPSGAASPPAAAARTPETQGPGMLWWSVMVLMAVGSVFLVDGFWMLVLIAGWVTWVLTPGFDKAARVIFVVGVVGVGWLLDYSVTESRRMPVPPVPMQAPTQ